LLIKQITVRQAVQDMLAETPIEEDDEELTEQTGNTIPPRLAPFIDYKAMAQDNDA